MVVLIKNSKFVAMLRRAGDYDIFDGMRLNDVLFMYGGFDDTIHYANTYLHVEQIS